MASPISFSRRELLRAGGCLVVSFAWGGAGARLGAQPGPDVAPRSLDPDALDSYLAIHADGAVTLYTSKVDVGTGLRMALAQVAAEELGVVPERITVVEGDTGECPNHGGTGGSTGLTRGGADIRRAAATARRALLDLGSQRLGRPAAELTVADGRVHPRTGGAGVAIGALVGGRRLSMAVDEAPDVAAPASYTVVGRPLLRPDVPGKVSGRYPYVQDFTLPGMWHARVVRPPALGARLLSVDDASLNGIPGARLVRVNSFLAVAARDEWAAVRGAGALRAIWSDWEGLPGSDGLADYVRSAEVARTQDVVARGGDPAAAFAAAATRLTATYFWPFQSHASLGPSCAVADVKADGSATVWSATQGSYGLRDSLARTFGLARDKVRMVFMEGAGSYGTNGTDHVAADAVLVSKTLGAPVRVQWMRADETAWDPKGPQQLLDIRAGLDGSGRIVAWRTDMRVPDGGGGSRALHAADFAGITQDHGQGSGDITQNGDPPYQADHVRVVAHLLKHTPLQLSNLRAPGKIANVFAVEGMTDELAAAAGVDAVAFRRARLTDPRALEAIDKAAEAFGWTARPSPNPDPRDGGWLVGRGFAYCRYKQAENYVAIAMEVAVHPVTGVVRVRRIACAHDCGLVVNPDGLRNQVEGCIVQTLSRALHEEVTFDRSRVTSVDWATYPILRFPEAPEVTVVLVNRPDQPLLGAGEAATAPVAAAVGNAIFDATGLRLRTVPLTPARLKAALDARDSGR
ncbi:MAG: molybdopterin cofactor-binding domain-containing protein [Vicinamibacterales bacterium]